MSRTLQVSPLTESELSTFLAAAEDRYAQQKTEFGSVDPDQARSQARTEMEAVTPGGQLPGAHAVLGARAENGTLLGSVWVAPRRGEPETAFIYDLVVDEAARGGGIGRILVRAAADWARGEGFASIGLHVFGGNTGAIALYESEGYETTEVLMRRQL